MKARISDLLPQPVPVNTGNGTFDVHGVSLEQVVTLIAKYRKDFLFLMALSRETGEPDYAQLITSAPAMVNDIIAYGADAAEDEDKVAIAGMPAGTKLVALLEIWRLSVPDGKKLRSLLATVRGQVEESAPQGPAPTSAS